MYATTLNLLLAGQYICPVAYEVEYAKLLDESYAATIDETLGRMDLRLARLRDDTAFFVAPLIMQSQHNSRAREELLRFRDVYGPAVRMLNLLRLVKEDFGLRMGEYLQLAEMERAVNNSASFESQLRALHGVIPNTAARYSNRDFLKKLLDNLRVDGFMVLANANNDTFRMTGKIEQIHAVLEFIAEQVAVTVEDKAAEPDDLVLDLQRGSDREDRDDRAEGAL